MIKILTVFFLFLLVYSIRLNYPAQPYFDETRVVPEATRLSTLSHYHGSSHPLLGKELIALSIHVLGNNPIAWRLPSLIFAAGATVLTAYLAFILTGNITLFWLVSLLLSLDGLWITQARIGLYNSDTIFFIMATLVFWWKGQTDEQKRSIFWIIAAICFGLTVAVKWRAFPLILIPLIYYLLARPKFQPSPLTNSRWWIYGTLIVVLVYFSTFLVVPFIKGMHWSDIATLQFQIVRHATRPYAFDHPYFSPWYSWPLMTRPIWFYFLRYIDDSIPIPSQTVEGIMCVGNPFIFMLIIPAMIWLAVNFWRQRNPISIVMLSGFLLFWLPSAVLKFTYFYQFYYALPFAVIAIAYMLDHMWASNKKPLRILTVGALSLILLGYVFFLPLWTASPVLERFFRIHMWLPSWI